MLPYKVRVMPDHDENSQYESNAKEQHGRPRKESNRGFVEEQEEGFWEEVDKFSQDSDQREGSSNLVWADQFWQDRPATRKWGWWVMTMEENLVPVGPKDQKQKRTREV